MGLLRSQGCWVPCKIQSPQPLLSAHPPVLTANKWGLVAERLLDLSASFSNVLTRVQVFVRRLLELHIFKLVALYTVWVALKEVRVGHTFLACSGVTQGTCWPTGEGASPRPPPGSSPLVPPATRCR